MHHNDNSYKSFFSEPLMMRELLTGFIDEEWVQHLDLNTLETVKSSFVTDDLREREDDVIWRVRHSGEWIYVYLLIEFQSSIDKFMAVRLMGYVALLYQDLIKQHQLTPSQKLPPVFPVVLYNGEKRWNAVAEVRDLVHPVRGGLDKYTPSLCYMIIDQGRWVAEDRHPPELRNVVNALFRMEHSRSPESLVTTLSLAAEWLRNEPRLRRVFLTWLKRVMIPRRFPGVVFDDINDLYEAKTMLAERINHWSEELLEKGKAQGKLEGESALLHRQLTRRFGILSAAIAQRLTAATEDELALWADRILDADSLEGVFGDKA